MIEDIRFVLVMSLSVTASVEIGMADGASSGLADGEGGQHQSRG